MATSWSLFQTKKGNKKHENNHGKQSPVRFRVILDINWLLCEEFKMHPHSWYDSIRSAMTPWNCVQLLFVFLQAEAVICKKEILVKGVNGGFCYLTYLNNKIICLLIFPLLYCQVMLSTVTPIITKISSSARGIRQLQIVQLTSQWSGKCAVKQIRRPIKGKERQLIVSPNSRCLPNQRFDSFPYWLTRCIQI